MVISASLLLVTCVGSSSIPVQPAQHLTEAPQPDAMPVLNVLSSPQQVHAEAIKPAVPDATVDVEWSARSREANLDTVLKRGSRGAVVTRLQARLARLGYLRASIDGDFGLKTQAAVMQFQDAHGLVVDGVVAASSWAKLNSKIAQLGQVPSSQSRQQQTIQPGRSSLPSSTAVSTTVVSTAFKSTVTASAPRTNWLSQKTGWIAILVIVQGAGWLVLLQGLNKELVLLTGRSLFPGKQKQWLFSLKP